MYECKHYQQTYIYVWGVLVSDSSVSSLCALGGPNYKHLFSNCLIAEHSKEKTKANEVEQKNSGSKKHTSWCKFIYWAMCAVFTSPKYLLLKVSPDTTCEVSCFTHFGRFSRNTWLTATEEGFSPANCKTFSVARDKPVWWIPPWDAFPSSMM